MGELSIRRNRDVAVSRYQPAGKAEKAAGRGAVETKGFTVSQTLERLMTRVDQAESRTRESRRTLRTGEAALAEVREGLGRMAELAQEAAEGKDPAALQEELKRLAEEVDRMLANASAGGTRLFLDGEPEGGVPLYALLGKAGPEGVQTLPDWLLRGLTGNGPTPEELLAALGLDASASAGELLAAVLGGSLESDAAVGYLAALYLGSLISGSAGGDEKGALEGLRQLLEKVAEGVPPDRALELLTGGEFSSLADYESQFSGGMLPGLQDFLSALLLDSGGEDLILSGSSLLALLAGTEGVKLDLMMGLLESLRSPEAAQTSGAAPEGQGEAPAPLMTASFGPVEVSGRDLSGVSYNPDTGTLTVTGEADVTLRGTGEAVGTLEIASTGTVTLRDTEVSLVLARGPEARLLCPEETVLGEVRLGPGTALVLGGGGPVRPGTLEAAPGGTLRLTEGVAVTVETLKGEDGEGKPLPLPVVLEGPVSLAAQGVQVTNAAGKSLDPFDLVWKTLLPGWSAVTALSVDGKQGRVPLDPSLPARLWLEKGDPGHGAPIHRVMLRGRDPQGRPKTRYAYLRWNQRTEAFEEVSMYPNPFTVTGGEPGRDWVYEEESHTLRIFTNQVTAVSGGAGTDGNRLPFSGRIALSDGIGPVELALEGVTCRVERGGAFLLGRENEVTLLLRNGTRNFFESGEGFAGISLGDGTSLCVDRGDPPNGGVPDGTLTASGRGGGAGIGRDSEGGRDRTSRILIRGGVITAQGAGGGSGIGAGKGGFMGPVTLLGGTVDASGEKGGAGIGGGLGAPVGDISIHGGTVTASAADHAAAIGAGVQGSCGDIRIDGAARIRRARGGNPGADIGACLFGGCGEVQVSPAANIGGAKLCTRSGVTLQMGEDAVTLPQFRLSARALGLETMSLATREEARAAGRTLEADCLWVERIQAAYGALYTRLERSFSGLRGVYQYINVTEGLVRDRDAAGSLLRDTRRSIPQPASQAMRTHGRRGLDGVERLLR